MQLMRLAHVNLSVDDLARADAFYGATLGLQRAPRPADAQRAGAWFVLGAAELHISVEAGADAVSANSKRHVAFEVSDLDGWRAKFSAAGFALVDGHPIPGMQRFFLRDPAGNRLEFYEAR